MGGEQDEVVGGSGAAWRGPYRVRLELFEGPLDLLLHLIKKNEVDVRELPVAAITEQYLAHLDLMRELNLDIAGEYLVMAATLTLIKSRMLLPSPEPEEGEEADPRAALVRQLLEYQRFREAAQALGERPLLRRDTFVREPGADGLPEAPPGADAAPRIRVTLWELMEAFRAVLQRAAPAPVHQVEGEPVSLRARIDSLLATLGVARQVTFDSLFGEQPTRSDVIVTFLAVLELMKQHVVEAVQEALMAPILIILAVDDVRAVAIDLLEEYEGNAASGPAPAQLAEE
jgi:segregation and condensation protein A